MAAHSSAAAPYYFFYFDVNGTVIAASPESKRTDEESLLEAIGQKVTAKWESGGEEMTYDDFIRKKYPLREDYYASRNAELEKLFDAMEHTGHSETEHYQKKFNAAIEKLQKTRNHSEFTVFSSFYKFLRELDKKQIKFSCVLATFANQAQAVAAAISNQFPHIQFQPQINLRNNTRGEESIVGIPIHSLVNEEQHHMIRYHYEPWGHDGDKKKEFAKKFPVFDTPEKISLFFDDNVRTDEECESFNIVSPYDPHTEKDMPISPLINHSIFCVDMFDAIIDDNYFVNLFETALAARGLSFL